MERYNRQIILPEIGIQGQQKLLDSKVLVIGAGGLGSPVLTYLAAAGIGTIGIVDDDKISMSNLQRQVLYKTNEVGLLKVDQAKKHLLSINNQININTYNTRLTTENAKTITKHYNIIVDCTDNYKSRYIIDEISKQLNIPMIYGSIAEYTGQVSVFNHNGSKSYKDLFPTPPSNNLSDKNNLGVIGTLPAIVGSIQANETIKIILNFNETLVQKLFLIDVRTMQTNIITY